MAAAKLAVEATGAISNFTISEAIDLNAAAKEAGKVAAAYKPAG